MKELLFLVAEKLVENNLSDQSILVCCSILKQAFIEQGFPSNISNEFAIDALKITMRTLAKIK